MKARFSTDNKKVWLRFMLVGLLVLAASVLLFGSYTSPVEAAEVVTLKANELLIVKPNSCALAITKSNADVVRITCTAFTPIPPPAARAPDTEVTKIHRKLDAGDKLKVTASPNCALVVKKNIETRIKVLCKPTIVPTPTPTGPDGHWSGSTSQAKKVSFNVTGHKTGFNSFKVQVTVGPCTGEITTPNGSIENDQMHAGGALNGGTVFWDGTFTSDTALTGTWEASNVNLGQCGVWNETGSWTAHWSGLLSASAVKGTSAAANRAVQFHTVSR